MATWAAAVDAALKNLPDPSSKPACIWDENTSTYDKSLEYDDDEEEVAVQSGSSLYFYGSDVAAVQTATGALGAPNAPPLATSLGNLVVDLACVGFFAWLYSREEKARERQMARIGREERLGRLRCELANGRGTRLEDLRGFARCVVVAGDDAYVRTALEDAERVREALIERGVLIIPVSTNGSSAVEPPRAACRFGPPPAQLGVSLGRNYAS